MENYKVAIIEFASLADLYNITSIHSLNQKKPESYQYISLPTHTILYFLIGFLCEMKEADIQNDVIYLSCYRGFFTLMQEIYTAEEMATLFYNLLGKDTEFRTLILTNFSKANSVSELSELTNMSKSVLQKRFKEEFHTNPSKWFLNKKKEILLSNLRLPNNTVKELMFHCGFDTASNFTRFFRYCFNCTPSEGIKKDAAKLEEMSKKL